MHQPKKIAGIAAIALASIAGCVWFIFDNGTERLFETITALATLAESNNSTLIFSLGFAAMSCISLCLIIPSGSLLMLSGGFILGALPATMIYFPLQFFLSIPLFLLAKSADPQAKDALGQINRFVPEKFRPVVWNLREESILLVVCLRLAPIVPSAVTCLLAPPLGVSLKSFMIANSFSCWVRPLFYASLGASLQELTLITTSASSISAATMLPIILAFVTASILLLVRLVLRNQLTSRERQAR